MSNPQWTQEAWYALANYEVKLGRKLSWKEQHEFILNYLEQREQLTQKKDYE